MILSPLFNTKRTSMTPQSIDAFWSKVDIANNTRECWNWRSAKKPSGYGNVTIDKKYRLAHRVAFELANGPIPPGFIVCHICDNPSCCNPQHLMLGTVKSNAADMLIKNRQVKAQYASRGVNNTNAKLTNEDVLRIRELYRNKSLNQYELSDKFGVSQTCIGSIVRRTTWRHI